MCSSKTQQQPNTQQQQQQQQQANTSKTMPSEAQLQKAQNEKRDLERELEMLEDAEDPSKAVQRIMDYIINNEEPLVMADNPWNEGSTCCVIL